MRRTRGKSIAVAAVVVLLVSHAVSARSRLFVGFGTSFGHGCSSLYRHYHPGWGFGTGYYRWIDRGYYHWLDRRLYRGHWPGHYFSSSIIIEDCWPVWVSPPVVVEHLPVVVEKRIVVQPRQYVYTPSYNPANAKLYARLRQKKSELLKALKGADKGERAKAIVELAGFSFDGNVRQALEDVLLKDPDPELRRKVAESLGKVKNKQVIPALEKARAEDPDQEVRRAADEAIRSIQA